MDADGHGFGGRKRGNRKDFGPGDQGTTDRRRGPEMTNSPATATALNELAGRPNLRLDLFRKDAGSEKPLSAR